MFFLSSSPYGGRGHEKTQGGNYGKSEDKSRGIENAVGSFGGRRDVPLRYRIDQEKAGKENGAVDINIGAEYRHKYPA